MRVLLCFTLLLFSVVAQGQFSIVKDINNQSVSASQSWQSIVVRDQLFFVADDGVHGTELWKSDGTAEGTILLKDIIIGSSHSFPMELTLVKDLLFFTAWDGVNTGRELWRTDGTPAGTRMVKDFLSGAEDEGPIQLTELNGILYFLATNGNGRELWRSDGTEIGTYVVKQTAVGWNGVYGLVKGNEKLFFKGHTSEHGDELWVSDGSETGTHELKDINPGVASGIKIAEHGILGCAEGVFFIGDDGTNGNELWISDGTESGTVMVTDFFLGNESGSISLTESALVNGRLFFPRYMGTELWSAGPAGATFVKTLSFPRNFSKFGNNFIFTARNEAQGEDLWISDGSPAGTIKVKTLRDNAAAPISKMKEINGKVYFATDNGISGLEPWVTDGTPEGTHQLIDLVEGSGSSFPDDFILFRDQVLFSGLKTGYGQELFREDGSLVKIVQQRTGPSIPWALHNFQGDLLFYDFNQRFYKTDGTEDGTIEITNNLTAQPSSFVEVNGRAFFIGGPNYAGDLYVTDGTNEGTQLFFDLNPQYYSFPIVHNNFLYFCNGHHLYKSDGTPEGTHLVKELPDDARVLISSGEYVYFSVNAELWRTDGTEAGTQVIKNVASTPSRMTSSGNSLYFHTNSDGNVLLWKSDGTEPGTISLKSFPNSTAWATNNNLVDVNGTLFFSAVSQNKHGLWKSDGTPDGTVPIIISMRNDGNLIPWSFKNISGTLFFTVSGYGYDELWKSDGTTDGTVFITDFDKKTGISFMMDIDGELFFVSSSVLSGWGIGKSDGTAAGSIVYYPQESGNVITQPVPVGDKIFFSFDSFRYGTELYVLETNSNVLCRNFMVKNLAGDSTICTGDPISLSASIINSGGSLSYIWRKDGVILEDQTSDNLLISEAAAENQGTYELTVSDGLCSMSPNKIEVIVKDVPMLTASSIQVASNEPIELLFQSTPDFYLSGYHVGSLNIPDGVAADQNNSPVENMTNVGADYFFNDRYQNGLPESAIVLYEVSPLSIMGCTGDAVSMQITVNPEAITGNETDDNISGISVYPNPVRDRFSIEFKSARNFNVEVYSLQGELLHSARSLDSNEKIIVSTNGWRTGSYFLILVNQRGQVFSRKIIKFE